jgi:hypothetical protein
MTAADGRERGQRDEVVEARPANGVVAVVAASVTAAVPAMAHGVEHALFAHNADKVDGKHAVGSVATTTQAAGKLVTTGSSGRFAPKFIPTSFAGPRAFASLDPESVTFLPGQQIRRDHGR